MTSPPAPPPDLSVVVPVFNEADNLEQLTAEIAAALAPLGRAWELLFVDDGSTDRSPQVMAALREGDARIRIARSRRNAGQSAALAAGFRLARAPVVVMLDADLQNDPADIPRLLAALDEGTDVVCGVRRERHDSWVRRFSSRVGNGFRNRVTHESIRDVGCTLRACRTAPLLRVPVFNGMHRFLPTLLRLAGARVREIPVAHRPRLHGTSKYGIGNRMWRGLVDVLAVRWLQSRWIDTTLVEEVPAALPQSAGPSPDLPGGRASSAPPAGVAAGA